MSPFTVAFASWNAVLFFLRRSVTKLVHVVFRVVRQSRDITSSLTVWALNQSEDWRSLSCSTGKSWKQCAVKLERMVFTDVERICALLMLFQVCSGKCLISTSTCLLRIKLWFVWLLVSSGFSADKCIWRSCVCFCFLFLLLMFTLCFRGFRAKVVTSVALNASGSGEAPLRHRGEISLKLDTRQTPIRRAVCETRRCFSVYSYSCCRCVCVFFFNSSVLPPLCSIVASRDQRVTFGHIHIHSHYNCCRCF